jgi:hypothetical protein
MYSEIDIANAVEAGVLSPESANAFRNHVAEGRSAPAVDEEHFRLLTGFNDIFVSIAAALILVAVAWIGFYIGSKAMGGIHSFEGPRQVGTSIAIAGARLQSRAGCSANISRASAAWPCPASCCCSASPAASSRALAGSSRRTRRGSPSSST